MIQASSIEELNLEKACLTIGSFDGVHRGHQSLISVLKQTALEIKCPAVVLTFHPHPVVVLKGLTTPFYISTPEQKAELFSQLGVDYLITLPFNHSISMMSADEFMSKLVQHIGLHKLVVGCGFVLGKDRTGTIDVLSDIGKSAGYSVLCIDSVSNEKEIISSSLIRRQIEDGNIGSVTTSLGRFFSIKGKVIRGDGRGRRIGFPTANLAIWPQQLLPAPGVYRCLATVNEKTYLSVGNLGYRPTFTENTREIFTEIHLLNFSGDIYGEEVKVQFTHRLRGETKYASFQDLVIQINRDILAAREL